jgi:hypothetical protein
MFIVHFCMDRKASIVWCTMYVLCLTIVWHPCRHKRDENGEIEPRVETRDSRAAHRIQSATASTYTYIESLACSSGDVRTCTRGTKELKPASIYACINDVRSISLSIRRHQHRTLHRIWITSRTFAISEYKDGTSY